MTPPTLKELCAAVPKGPYFADHHKGTVKDFMAHSNSGLATVDTGRSGDWPIAYFCEWPQAQLIARLSPEVALQVYEALKDAHDFAGTCRGDAAAMIYMRTQQAMDALNGEILP